VVFLLFLHISSQEVDFPAALPRRDASLTGVQEASSALLYRHISSTNDSHALTSHKQIQRKLPRLPSSQLNSIAIHITASASVESIESPPQSPVIIFHLNRTLALLPASTDRHEQRQQMLDGRMRLLVARMGEERLGGRLDTLGGREGDKGGDGREERGAVGGRGGAARKEVPEVVARKEEQGGL
jgi:hypothetical protein